MNLLILLSALLAFAAAALNNSQSYQLKTQIKPHQFNKESFNNLWLTSYHTGAGLNDVVFQGVQDGSSRGFLDFTSVTSSWGAQYYNQLFDLGTDFPWGLQLAQYVNFYAAWQPVRMNAGVGGSDPNVSGFFINQTGLQWTSSLESPGSVVDSFGGWLVCSWWHGKPQLFFRNSFYGKSAYPAPASCADVDLVPAYI